MKRITILISAMTLFAAAASAQSTDHARHAGAPAASQAEAASLLAPGEIIKVDKDAAKVTIKHGALAHLKMPAMTMAFKVNSPAMLDQLKPGDKISFVAEKVNGALTVTALEPVAVRN
jgi:Cu/Ag efflux protein CusF